MCRWTLIGADLWIDASRFAQQGAPVMHSWMFRGSATASCCQFAMACHASLACFSASNARSGLRHHEFVHGNLIRCMHNSVPGAWTKLSCRTCAENGREASHRLQVDQFWADSLL